MFKRGDLCGTERYGNADTCGTDLLPRNIRTAEMRDRSVLFCTLSDRTCYIEEGCYVP